ncbi:MAG TPA: glycosyl transferase [Anaerolineaceae bacterium]|nr:glycosyl transferase [Anaerolineaceae bacterium]
MRFGYFDDHSREYVITRPDTPLPWITYLGTDSFFGLISNTAGGYSFYKDARLRRLTRYRYNNAPLDMGGRYIYLRDGDSGEVWSPSWMPVRKTLDSYECRHGMGYTAISSKKNGISVHTRYFVPLNSELEVWDVTLVNERAADARLDLFSAVEFALWDALDDSTNFQRNFNTGEVEVPDLQSKHGDVLRSTIFHKTEYRERRNHFAYFACSESLAGFDTQRNAFLGPYRGWDNPLVVENGQSGNSIAHGWQPIGSHHLKFDLKPGEVKRVVFLLGYHENPKNEKFDPAGSNTINKKSVLPIIREFLSPARVDAAFEELRNYWEGLLGKFTVQTPDADTNRMVNIWNAYQCMITFNMSRSASYFESGIGRGMGFRDSTQDLMGFVHIVPERARERLIDLAATQLSNGGAFHQYQPLTKRGNNDVGSDFNDDPHWFVLATAAYVRETGDLSILGELVPYENQPGTEMPLFEHLQRAVQYTLDRLGPHQLPLIGRADWNDCLNLNCFSDTPGQSFQTTTNRDGNTAESVMIAGLFVLSCQEMAQLASFFATSSVARAFDVHSPEFFTEKAKEMEQAVWQAGWDGEWFRRAYDAFGEPLGSRLNDEGQIFIEPQGLCVMAGLGVEDGKARQALDAVRERLATPHGIVVLNPAFTHYQLRLGEISSYPPGYKENASVFCHSNPWIMIAETVIGRGDRAFDYYKRINPSAREAISEVHRCEPYVYAQTIAGKDAPTHGEAKNSWLTGTASWNYVAITQYILGIKPTYSGLSVNPVIPGDWMGLEAKRIFRGVVYNIKVERRSGLDETRLIVDGQLIKDCIIPIPPVGTREVSVLVELAEK